MTVKRQSLVLITVDCLRADHCGFYGYARPTTPFLDSLASESVVVPNAVIAGAPTYFSLPAIFASRMPLALGRDVVGLAPGEETLASTLRQAGYATAAFSAANPYISPRFGYEQGFDVFRDFLEFDASAMPPSADEGSFRGILNKWLKNSSQIVGMEDFYEELYFQYCVRIAAPPATSIDTLRKFPSADAIVEAAEAWLDALDSRPFFLWLHLMDPHSPYYPPAAALRDLTGKELSPERVRYLNEFWNRSELPPSRLERHRQDVIDLYDAGIRWADSQISRLVRFLEGCNRWDDCVLALTADHGEEFLDHGLRYHAPVSLMEEIARAPLLIRAPGQPKVHRAAPRSGTEIDHPSQLALPFSHLHLAPTLLDILDVPPPAGFQGKSLRLRLQEVTRGDFTEKLFASDDATAAAIAECVCACTNPFNAETLLSPRLLSVRDARYKLVIRLEPGAVEEIYDLDSDPEEKKALASHEAMEIRRRLLRIAAQHIEKSSAARPATARLKSRLRDLRLKLEA